MTSAFESDIKKIDSDRDRDLSKLSAVTVYVNQCIGQLREMERGLNDVVSDQEEKIPLIDVGRAHNARIVSASQAASHAQEFLWMALKRQDELVEAVKMDCDRYTAMAMAHYGIESES